MKRTLKVHVNGISSGKTKNSVSMKIDRADLAIADADDLLCGASLQMFIIPGTDVAGQTTMFDEKLGIEFDATCGRIGVSPAEISTSINIADNAVDLNALARFKFKTCKATFKRTGDAADIEDEPADPAQGTLEDEAKTAAADKAADKAAATAMVDTGLAEVAKRGRGRPPKAVSESTSTLRNNVDFVEFQAQKMKLKLAAEKGAAGFKWCMSGHKTLMTLLTGGAVETHSEREFMNAPLAVRDGVRVLQLTLKATPLSATADSKPLTSALAEIAGDCVKFLGAAPPDDAEPASVPIDQAIAKPKAVKKRGRGRPRKAAAA